MTIDTRVVLGILILAGGFAAPGTLLAQDDYPNKVVRLVVPFAPAGPTDLAARLLAEKLALALRQPVIVENKAGAGGMLGSEFVAKSPADGYTLLYGSTSTLAVVPAIYNTRLNYDPAALSPVALVAKGQTLLVTRPSFPGNTLQELIEYARTGKKATYSSGGVGTIGHLAAELLKDRANFPATHVPYRGGGPALQAVLSGEVDFAADVVTTSLPFAQAGKLKPLVLLSSTRSSLMPDVPTAMEAGLGDFNADFFSGIVGPAGMPQSVVARLNREIQKVLALPEFRDRLVAIGLEPQAMSVSQFGAFIKAEAGKWGMAVRNANVKAE